MKCSKCGTENNEGAKFCKSCGMKLPAEQPLSIQTFGPAAPAHTTITEAYIPISMWGYFGYGLLFEIPFVGWILSIVFALGGTNNINLRNFARSRFCVVIIKGILLALLAQIVMAFASAFLSMVQ